MKVFILGHGGNMGHRYKTILRFLGHSAAGYDKAAGKLGNFDIEEADRVIIATPTVSHAGDLHLVIPYRKPILCEKPVSTDRHALNDILTFADTHSTLVSMVSQYDHMPFSRAKADLTKYDYFKHGGDGLYWDCINIIYHAKGRIALNNTSPIWRCSINGDPLNLADIDYSYIKMLDEWTANPQCGSDRIWAAHEKVRKLEAEQCKQC